MMGKCFITSTNFNVKITVSCKYMRTLPFMPCYPASLPSFHPLSVILGTEDRAHPVAFKPTLKPQSQLYLPHWCMVGIEQHCFTCCVSEGPCWGERMTQNGKHLFGLKLSMQVFSLYSVKFCTAQTCRYKKTQWEVKRKQCGNLRRCKLLGKLLGRLPEVLLGLKGLGWTKDVNVLCEVWKLPFSI